MEYYLLTARSITHAQQMERVLGRAGVSAKIRRIGGDAAKNGCGYTLQIPARLYQRAADALRGAGPRPVRVFRVVNGTKTEVVM